MPDYFSAPASAPPETDTVALPSNPAFEVTLYRRVPWQAHRAAENAATRTRLMQIEGTDNFTANSSAYDAYLAELICRSIVGWNLTAGGEPLPVTPEILARLDEVDGKFLKTEVERRRGARSEEQERDFGKGSGKRSRATRSR